jgi:hypothetical protein
MKPTVIGGDFPGLKALRERMQDANRAVMVGVPAGKTEPDGTSLAMIAAVHEFGSPENGIPERSFIRAGILRGRTKFERLNAANLRLVVLGQKTVEQAIEQLGVVAAGEVKREFTVGTFEPLKPATIARKGSSKPLLDSGNLRQAVTYVIEPAGGKVA